MQGVLEARLPPPWKLLASGALLGLTASCVGAVGTRGHERGQVAASLCYRDPHPRPGLP